MTTEIAKPGATKTLRDWLADPVFQQQVGAALPSHITPERFARVALTTINRVPGLAKCSQTSVFEALLTCSQLGLEPDGRLAHLIPYGGKCQLIVDYKGYVELSLRSGLYSLVHADVVRERDSFVFNLGRIERHSYSLGQDRGNVIGAFAMVKTRADDKQQAVVMSKDEVEAIRKRSKQANSGPWVTDWEEMAKKTAFRRLSKWLSLSPEIRDQIAREDDLERTEPVRITGSSPADRLLSVLTPTETTSEAEPVDTNQGDDQ